ncbi:BPI fold-containing family C protein-like [Pseudophryne corroboree]|uniref:BPI fold-containing family C protein-like n=1 Tax=Pseudophryne corroboree TaxID=495146 RepID=UPI0030816FC9
MLWFTIITSILLSLSGICYSDNPGMKIRITGSALDKSVKYLMNNIISQEKEYQLPDVIGSTTVDNEPMKYEFKQIRLTSFYCPTISSKWVSGTGLQISMKDGSATINSTYSIDYWLVKDSASSVLTLSEISVSLVLGVHEGDPGMPSISLLDCQSTVQGIDVKLLSDVSYIYNDLQKSIQNLVGTNINQQICAALRNSVNQWDQSLSHLNLNLSLNNLIGIDLSLVGNPEITEQYADIGLKGLFYSINETGAAFAPTPMLLPIKSRSMLYAGISEASGNSLFDAYYSTGSFYYEISHMAGSKNITTSELAACIPEISQHFPTTAPVKIKVSATSSPNMYLHSNNMTIKFLGLIQTFAYPLNSEPQYLFSAKIVASFNANFSLSNAKDVPGLNLAGSISLIRLQMDKSPSDTKASKVVVTEDKVQKLLTEVVLPAVNEKIAQGMLIPGTFLVNPSINIKEGFALLAADMKEESSKV